MQWIGAFIHAQCVCPLGLRVLLSLLLRQILAVFLHCNLCGSGLWECPETVGTAWSDCGHLLLPQLSAVHMSKLCEVQAYTDIPYCAICIKFLYLRIALCHHPLGSWLWYMNTYMYCTVVVAHSGCIVWYCCCALRWRRDHWYVHNLLSGLRVVVLRDHQ